MPPIKCGLCGKWFNNLQHLKLDSSRSHYHVAAHQQKRANQQQQQRQQAGKGKKGKQTAAKAAKKGSSTKKKAASSKMAKAAATTKTATTNKQPQPAEAMNMDCAHCGLLFKDQTLYLLHKGLHSEADPWRCNLCKQPCGDKYSFTTHLISAVHA